MFSCDAGHVGIPCDSAMKFLTIAPHVRLRCFAIWPLGVRWMGVDLSEEHVPSIIGVTLHVSLGRGKSTVVIRNLNL